MSQASDTLRREFKKNDDIRDAGLTTPADVQRFDDIRYGTDADCQLLDVYRPKKNEMQNDADSLAGDASGEKEDSGFAPNLKYGALPVIISIHGGGWVYGDKELYQYYCMSLAQRGFAVVNFTYRLAPEYKFPSCQEDTNLVVSWVLAHAQEYGFDTEHIFMVGDSAGAHALGLYVGICTNPEYAALYPFTVPQEFRPTAIALNCGVYWMDEEVGIDSQTMELMNDLFEDGATRENLEKICVPKTITENYVPTYFMTCTGDFLVSQAPLLYSKLLECRVPCEFQFYGDKDHELGHVFHLNMKSEIAAVCNDAQCEFFRKFL